jgi:hypothetical protein
VWIAATDFGIFTKAGAGYDAAAAPGAADGWLNNDSSIVDRAVAHRAHNRDRNKGGTLVDPDGRPISGKQLFAGGQEFTYSLEDIAR